MSITLKQVQILTGNTETEVFAAEELQKYLEKKNVAVVEGGYPITITYDNTLSRQDGFRVSADANGMTIAGGTEHAVLYGVYKFLEQYAGVRYFLPGLENGMFPSMSALAEHTEMEEERRLAYVAITRAKERLFLTHAKERLLYGSTQYNPLSRFVKEIPPMLLDKKDEREAPRARVSGMGYQQKIFGGIGGPRKPVTPKAPIEKFTTGARVLHPVFGEGTVLSVRDLGSDTLYEVMFDTVGTKKLMGNMAKLKKVE